MRNQLSWSIVKRFSGKNMLAFEIRDVEKEFPEKSPGLLSMLLAEMVHKGMLSKITRKKYHIIPLHEDPDTYTPSRHQVASYLMQSKAYYIGYASAMQIHGLKIQPDIIDSDAKGSGIKEYIVTETQVKPSTLDFRGTTYQFIQHGLSKFFGYQSAWINQFEKAFVSDLEKTIVDIATKPQFCGGIVELGNALLLAKTRIDHGKLFYYFARNRNKSARKRFLFLTDLLGLEWTSDHSRMKEELGAWFSILDPLVSDHGKKRKQLGLIINVDPDIIRKKVLHH